MSPRYHRYPLSVCLLYLLLLIYDLTLLPYSVKVTVSIVLHSLHICCVFYWQLSGDCNPDINWLRICTSLEMGKNVFLESPSVEEILKTLSWLLGLYTERKKGIGDIWTFHSVTHC